MDLETGSPIQEFQGISYFLNDEGDFELLNLSVVHIEHNNDDSKNTCRDLTVNDEMLNHFDNDTFEDQNEVILNHNNKVIINQSCQEQNKVPTDDSASNEDDLVTICENETSLAKMNESFFGEINDLGFTEEIKIKQKKNPAMWAKTLNQKERLMGREYLGKKKIEGKWVYDLPKPSKTQEPPCNCLKKKKSVKCRSFSDGDRKEIFRKFWDELCTWREKRLVITTLVLQYKPRNIRNRMVQDQSRRNKSLRYHLTVDDKILPVCKTMFLSTYGVSQNIVYLALRSFQTETIEAKKILQRQKQEQRIALKQTSSARIFLMKLNKVESHFCRKNTSKLYLEPLWQSKMDVYRAYEEYCNEESLKIQCLTTFYETFNDLNLSLFRPKKDQCDTCTRFKNGNIGDIEYQLHIIDKNLARDEKEKDTQTEKNVFTMDQQSILLCPLIKASAGYFKMKLGVHNFTIFDNITKDASCYLWHEGEANLTACEFATIVCKFIVDKLEEERIKPGERVILYSDGCTNQNRNSTMSNALLNLAIQLKITIIQKILEKGHTQMQCDSMHATIERKVKGKDIHTPAGYVHACLLARLKPKRYHVEYLNHTYFKNFNDVAYYNSIRPGKKKGDPCVVNIRGLMYLPTGSILYKLRYLDEWKDLPQPQNLDVESIPFKNLPSLYTDSQKIKENKFKHLQELKEVIPEEFHSFYDNLSH